MDRTANPWDIKSLNDLELAAPGNTASPFPWNGGVPKAAGQGQMSEADYQRLLGHLDEALKVFRHYEGRLRVRDIRFQSLITVLRQEIAEEAKRQPLQAI